jgi:hypothetical protein
MLTSVLVEDCRDFISDVVLRSRTLGGDSLGLHFIELGGDAIVCLDEYAEAVNVSEKVSIIQCALRLFKRLQTRIELGEKSSHIPEALANEWLQKCGKLISRLKKALLDCKKHDEMSRHTLGTSKTVFTTDRLEVRTPSESDISCVSEAMSELFPQSSCFFLRDAVRHAIINEDFGKICLIARKGDKATVGAVVVSLDFEDCGRARIDILISENYRCRGYFTEVLDGFVKSGFVFRGKGTVSIFIPDSCAYLIRTCSRLGFSEEGEKRALHAGKHWIVMSRLSD